MLDPFTAHHCRLAVQYNYNRHAVSAARKQAYLFEHERLSGHLEISGPIPQCAEVDILKGKVRELELHTATAVCF